MRALALCVSLAGPAGLVAALEPIALDNGAIRLEIDPDLFAIRFIGAPGETNLIAPFHVSLRARTTGRPTVDPGGVTVYANVEGKTSRVDGPAEVESQSDRAVALLSAPIDDTGLRIRMELVLDAATPDAMLRVAFRTTNTDALGVALTIRTVLTSKTTLRLPKPDATILGVTPERLTGTLLVDAGEYWVIEPDGAAAGDLGSATVTCDSNALEMRSGSRFITRVFGIAGTDDRPMRLQYRRDGAGRQRTVHAVAPAVDVDLWNQPAVTESWSLQSLGE